MEQKNKKIKGFSLDVSSVSAQLDFACVSIAANCGCLAQLGAAYAVKPSLSLHLDTADRGKGARQERLRACLDHEVRNRLAAAHSDLELVILSLQVLRWMSQRFRLVIINDSTCGWLLSGC